jgi:hypothetical protein
LLIRSGDSESCSNGDRVSGRPASHTPRLGWLAAAFFQHGGSAESTVITEKQGNRDLPRKGDARLAQLVTQALLVYGFQQARAGMAMHLDRQSDHSIGQWFRQKHKTFSVITVFSALSPC